MVGRSAEQGEPPTDRIGAVDRREDRPSRFVQTLPELLPNPRPLRDQIGWELGPALLGDPLRRPEPERVVVGDLGERRPVVRHRPLVDLPRLGLAVADRHLAADRLLDRADVAPDGVARRSFGYDDLRETVGALAAWYLGQGVGRGAFVALYLREGIDSFFHFLALNSIGATPVLVNGNLRAERGLSSFDVRHTFNLNLMFGSPFGSVSMPRG